MLQIPPGAHQKDPVILAGFFDVRVKSLFIFLAFAEQSATSRNAS
jgi:hypothetical protein